MGSRLYIGNLSWDTTEETLSAALSEGGRNVTDIHIVTDRETGRPRGFAFAEFATDVVHLHRVPNFFPCAAPSAAE